VWGWGVTVEEAERGAVLNHTANANYTDKNYTGNEAQTCEEKVLDLLTSGDGRKKKGRGLVLEIRVKQKPSIPIEN